MDYLEEQNAFWAMSDASRSDKFTKTELVVLDSYYDKSNPCSPNPTPFLNRMAGILFDKTRINSLAAAYIAAKKALDSGQTKVRKYIVDQPQEPEAQVKPVFPNSEPWWARY